MSEPRRIVIADDSRLFREGLKAILSQDTDYEIAGEAADGLDAIRTVRRTNPDLVILDLSMPRMSGFSVVREIKRATPQIKVLVLSVHESQEHILNALEAGADGYALKDASRAELRLAVDSVLNGKRYVNPNAATQVILDYLVGGKEKPGGSSLSQREKEVIKLIGEGYQNKEIATLLNISRKTVEKHRANIMAKLDLHNAAKLAAYACEHGYATPKGGPMSLA